MSRKQLLPIAVLAVALILAIVAVVRMSGEAPQDDLSGATVPAANLDADSAIDTPDGEEAVAPAIARLRRLGVQVYYRSPEGRGLVGEAREIFETRAPGDRAKQIINDLLSGPNSDDALHTVPQGTRLRQVFVMDDGVAYLDFSAELRTGLGGGSREELLTVYSIVDSVALNIKEIKRVAILIDGRTVETLNGHLDLRRPLPPNRSLIVGDVS